MDIDMHHDGILQFLIGRMLKGILDKGDKDHRRDHLVARLASDFKVNIIFVGGPDLLQGYVPVSYTHLDVYKRQPMVPCARESDQLR